MSEQGFIGVTALWLVIAIATLALVTLASGKWQQAHARNQLVDVKMMALAQSALLLEREAGFDAAHRRHEFSEGRVSVERVFLESGQSLRLTCVVQFGKNEKRVETGWRRVGGEWQAAYWREF